MNPEGTRELLRRKIERETTDSSPDSAWCETCEAVVVHLEQYEDERHCPCNFGGLGRCSCSCHVEILVI